MTLHGIGNLTQAEMQLVLEARRRATLKANNRRARELRYGTKFGAFVMRHSPAWLIEQLNERMLGRKPLNQNHIYVWLSGTSYPRHETLDAIVAVSAGELSHEDIYSHVKTMRSRRAVEPPMVAVQP